MDELILMTILNKQHITMKDTQKLIYILLGLPMIIYPFVLLANMMSASGFASKASDLKLFVVNGFLWSSLLYPISFLLALIPSIKKRKYGFTVPLIHLVIVLVFFGLWAYLD